MGTGGGSNKKAMLAARVAEYLNYCIQALDHEFGKPGVKVQLLRNSQESGCYLLRNGNTEVEIRITEAKK